jgi:hypothetical protein
MVTSFDRNGHLQDLQALQNYKQDAMSWKLYRRIEISFVRSLVHNSFKVKKNWYTQNKIMYPVTVLPVSVVSLVTRVLPTIICSAQADRLDSDRIYRHVVRLERTKIISCFELPSTYSTSDCTRKTGHPFRPHAATVSNFTVIIICLHFCNAKKGLKMTVSVQTCSHA